MAEIEYWRARNAVISTLHQQLSNPMITQVKKLLMIYLNDNTSIVAEFEKQMMDLTKLYGEAKDNVKFLTTLER
jgi:dynein heavy chain